MFPRARKLDLRPFITRELLGVRLGVRVHQ